MRTYLKLLALEVFLVAGWLAASPQITPPSVGRLHITSNPAGADITIDNNLRPEKTNVTLVVSPRTYSVAISGGPGNLNCPARPYQVSSGQTVEVTCP